MDDIAPELLEAIRRDFLKFLGDAKPASMDYAAVQKYAEKVGEALAEAFRKNLRADVLPDGRLYWNLAEKIVRPMLTEDHRLVADAAQAVQQAMNKAAGIGLKAQRAPLDEDKVNGLLNRAAAAEDYEKAAWVLDEPVKTFSIGVADDTLKRNIEFQGRAGLSPRVIRKAESTACKWCRKLEGVYEYPDVPKDVYRRHEACRCTVEYDPADTMRRRRNVHTKKWKAANRSDIIKGRSSGKTGDTDGSSRITSTETIDFYDRKAVARRISDFLRRYSDSPEEHAIVIAPSGRVYNLTGTKASVNTALVGTHELKGSIGAHNHPVWNGYPSGDSFSKDDVVFSVQYHTGMEFLTSGARRNSFEYTGKLSPVEIAEKYDDAKRRVLEKMFEGEATSEFVQEEIMKVLAQDTEGFCFYEHI